MIISHRWKFIFIKTRKTAGTSLELALSTVCGSDDVVTPVTDVDEALRAGLGGRAPQNCEVDPARHTPLQRLAVAFGARAPRYYNHMSAAAVRATVAPEVWDGYFKFAFDRNPWDKVVSAYHWQFPQEPRPTLDEFVSSGRVKLYRNAPLYTDRSGALLVDQLGRYEDLATELEGIRVRLRLPPLPPLPMAKGGFRSDRRGPAAALSAAAQARIARVYRDEVERFGYRCE